MSDQNISLEKAEQALGQISAGHILDVATGNGGFITYLLNNIKDFTEITAIDLNERPLKTARKAFTQDNIQFLCMDAAHCDFPEANFDSVCIANSLHHMGNLPLVLTEMLRVCKPGGHVIISEMYRDDQTETQLTHVYLHHWWAAVDRLEGITHNETYTRQEIIDIAGKMGLHAAEHYDLRDLDSDPKDEKLIQQLDSIIDHYLQRAKGLHSETGLLKIGERLRQRIHEVGFHGATNLLIMGKK